MTPIDRVLAALEALNCRPRKSGKGWTARCPAHHDKHPSLAIAEGCDGRALIHCFAGCATSEIASALGLELKDLMPPGEGRPWTHWGPNRLSWSQRARVITENRDQSRRPDFNRLMTRFRQAINPSLLAEFGQTLGVSVESLRRLGIAYALGHRAWAFPMRNPTGDIVGIRLRGIDRSKRSIRNSQQGLFIPEGLRPGGLLLICEGASDTAAALTLGLEAVGRPSCVGGEELVAKLVQQQKPVIVVVVADNDGPGIKGGQRMAEKLAGYDYDVRLVVPNGAKDLREWLQQGAARETVLKACEQAEKIHSPTRLRRHLVWTT